MKNAVIVINIRVSIQTIIVVNLILQFKGVLSVKS